MAHRVNRQILLKSRPEGAPSLDNFELTESPVREPGEGEVLTRTLYLSLDPYMRGRMSAANPMPSRPRSGSPWSAAQLGRSWPHAIRNTRSVVPPPCRATKNSRRWRDAPIDTKCNF